MTCCSSNDNEEQEPNPSTRGCTDVFWLCLYIAFWFLMVVVAAFSFVYGNPIRIINGSDSFGNTCGTKHNKAIGDLQSTGLDTSSKPYLLFYDLKELKQSLKICVKECPKKTLHTIKDIDDYHKAGVDVCKYNFDYGELSKSSGQAKLLSSSIGPCPVLPVYESTPVLNRCVPKPVKEVQDAILGNMYDLLNSSDMLEQVLSDVYNTWREIVGLAFLSLFISLLTICVLHLLAHLVSYFIMIGFGLASIAGTCYLWYTFIDIKYNLDKTKDHMMLLEAVRNETAFLTYSIVATIITVVILIIIIFMRKQVDFLADLFKETSKCLLHIPGLFLQPILTFIVWMLFIIFWIFVVLCLATAYYPGTTDLNSSLPAEKPVISTTQTSAPLVFFTNGSISKLKAVEYIDASWIKGMWWVYFIGLIWTSEFIMACQQMVIAGAVAHWFYQGKYKDDSHVCYAICKLIKYHLGSVALGSLIITIFKIPRLILMYLHEKLKYNKDKGSECASCGLKCCICCFYCLEKFIRYLNHNAYTVIAIDGSSFCTAAGTAFEVLTSHALQVATINGLGDFILFLGKCFVTAVTGCIGLAVFRHNAELKFYAIPTLLVCVFAFLVAHCILSLYEMVLDTVYLCMCQSGEAPHSIQSQNLGITTNGNGQPAAEMQPIK